MENSDQQHDQRSRATRAAAPEVVKDYQREVQILSQLLRQQEKKAAEHRRQLDWCARVHQRLATHPRWWWMLPESRRQARRYRSLKSAGLFDAEAYLQRYPDVAEAGLDPLHHFLNHGVHEDRIPIGPGD